MRAGLPVATLALVAVVVAWWCTVSDAAAPHAATPSVAPAAERTAESSAPARVERAPTAPLPEPADEPAARPNTADPGGDASSDPAQPWLARFQVVDEGEQLVAGARVVVWRAFGAQLHRARASSARVDAAAERGERAFFAPDRHELYGACAAAVTDDGGAFELLVHPGTTWTLQVRPTAAAGGAACELKGVAPGAVGVLVRCADADLAGCVVRGTVTRADGVPIANCRVAIVQFHDDGSVRSSGGQTFEGAEYQLAPLPLGKRFALRIGLGGDRHQPGPYAPTTIGPFTTDRPELTCDARLVAWGTVPILVRDASGAPVRSVRVDVRHDVFQGSVRVPREVDGEGRIVIERCAPGPAKVVGYDAGRQLFEQELFVTPGPNAEVVVRLPAR